MVSKSKILIVSILIISVTLVWLIAPFLSNLFATSNEPFSELWLLGPERTAENYPHDITSNQEYTVYLGASNQLNEDAEYSIHVKLSDGIKQLLNSTAAEYSLLPSIRAFDFSLSDEETWETRFVFALDYSLIQENLTRIENIKINGATFSVNQNILLDPRLDSFYIILVFELWSNNGTDNTLQYTNQHLQLFLKLDS
ncbi:MAG: DUF1616 domain-containing protein [Candidatus Bathyarchaeum tardum]|nr:MAG: DUF1616 domain-containing protein [Candidatus Bathyarchaeum tardum]